MINDVQRFVLDGEELVEDRNGNLVTYAAYVELVATAIEGAANQEFLQRQVPDLKKALVDILLIAAKIGGLEMIEIRDIAAKAIAQ